MATIIVHGTFAANGDWYWNSWHKGGFCHTLAKTMVDHSGRNDLWKLNNISVEDVAVLNPKRSLWTGRLGQIRTRKGYFFWSGDYMAVSRHHAANDLARYLNVLHANSDEPIRVIAHSHGCNVVKQASASKKLEKDVRIESAVFLACPHMFTDEYTQNSSFDVTMRRSGTKYLYQLQPKRFKRIANIYSTQDPVVGKLADKLVTPSGWGYEVPMVSFIDNDPNAGDLYANHEMDVPSDIRGLEVHEWLHSSEMAYLIGRWLETSRMK